MEANNEQEGICVAIRIRPLNEVEVASGQSVAFQCIPQYNQIGQLKDGQIMRGQTFDFDKVYDDQSTTNQIYTATARNMVMNVMDGINGTIFAYGQTNSGKTHTILGQGDTRGILEMAIDDVFQQIEIQKNRRNGFKKNTKTDKNDDNSNINDNDDNKENTGISNVQQQIKKINVTKTENGNNKESKENTSRDFILKLSFIEIYNEKVFDLLSSTKNIVTLREDKKTFYSDATEIIIEDHQSIIKALKTGLSSRIVEGTALNKASSRSHTILRLVVESKESQRCDENNNKIISKTNDTNEDKLTRISSLTLVDLAGSENVKHAAIDGPNQTQRFLEGRNINQSLHSLNNVFLSLTDPKCTYVNFRGSKLTQCLQVSLNGNSNISIICCINPSKLYIDETRSTLLFAKRAKLVKTNAKRNEIMDDTQMLRKCRRESEMLKIENEKLKVLLDDAINVCRKCSNDENEKNEKKGKNENEIKISRSAVSISIEKIQNKENQINLNNANNQNNHNNHNNHNNNNPVTPSNGKYGASRMVRFSRNSPRNSGSLLKIEKTERTESEKGRNEEVEIEDMEGADHSGGNKKNEKNEKHVNDTQTPSKVSRSFSLPPFHSSVSSPSPTSLSSTSYSLTPTSFSPTTSSIASIFSFLSLDVTAPLTPTSNLINNENKEESVISDIKMTDYYEIDDNNENNKGGKKRKFNLLSLPSLDRKSVEIIQTIIQDIENEREIIFNEDSPIESFYDNKKFVLENIGGENKNKEIFENYGNKNCFMSENPGRVNKRVENREGVMDGKEEEKEGKEGIEGMDEEVLFDKNENILLLEKRYDNEKRILNSRISLLEKEIKSYEKIFSEKCLIDANKKIINQENKIESQEYLINNFREIINFLTKKEKMRMNKHSAENHGNNPLQIGEIMNENENENDDAFSSDETEINEEEDESFNENDDEDDDNDEDDSNSERDEENVVQVERKKKDNITNEKKEIVFLNNALSQSNKKINSQKIEIFDLRNKIFSYENKISESSSNSTENNGNDLTEKKEKNENDDITDFIPILTKKTVNFEDQISCNNSTDSLPIDYIPEKYVELENVLLDDKECSALPHSTEEMKEDNNQESEVNVESNGREVFEYNMIYNTVEKDIVMSEIKVQKKGKKSEKKGGKEGERSDGKEVVLALIKRNQGSFRGLSRGQLGSGRGSFNMGGRGFRGQLGSGRGSFKVYADKEERQEEVREAKEIKEEEVNTEQIEGNEEKERAERKEDQESEVQKEDKEDMENKENNDNVLEENIIKVEISINRNSPEVKKEKVVHGQTDIKRGINGQTDRPRRLSGIPQTKNHALIIYEMKRNERNENNVKKENNGNNIIKENNANKKNSEVTENNANKENDEDKENNNPNMRNKNTYNQNTNNKKENQNLQNNFENKFVKNKNIGNKNEKIIQQMFSTRKIGEKNENTESFGDEIPELSIEENNLIII